MQTYFDYIITGAGCAGLSLLRRMMAHPFFSNKKILVIDKEQKNNNDRTWCFWEQQPGLFEELVYHRWQQIDFYSDHFSARYDLAPYQYKMIRSIDLYSSVSDKARRFSNISILQDDVQSVMNNENNVTVKTNGKELLADHVFNSIIFNDWREQALQQKNIYVLLQHFKGWMIETDKDVFDERRATFMDFRISQDKGTAFVYVLPVAKNKALVEYTLFSENIPEQHEYDAALEDYIHSVLSIKKYTIAHAESGIIPMTNYSFPKGDGRLINIGTAGGQTKASSGYTFRFIQKHSERLINALVHGKDPLHMQSVFDKRFHLYDSILLNVLQNKKMGGDKIFAQLFKKNSPQTILKFLDNETNFMEELKVMNSVSLSAFLPATIRQIF
ncbi:MAG TPA: lycopene cyclase family protein [Parafilimonas sp.]|nr:lycopene cyclase family protein [Parafilimonas sp.]